MTGNTDDQHSVFFSSGSLLRKHQKPEGRRLVRKNGKSEITLIEPADFVTKHDKRSDLVHSLIDAKWKWTFSVLIFTFIFTWVFFAVLWMAIGVANGDEDDAEPIYSQCLMGISNFSGYLLFSIETQTSIGYGSRSITQNCFGSVILVCCQILIGMGLGGSMVSIVYAKMISPKTQHSDVSFTKHAVICQRDGELCLIFRTRDPSRKYEFQNSIRAFLIKMRNGDYLLKTLKLEPIGIILWPTEIVHRITETSPFWDLSAKDLVSRKFEIVVVMEGTALSTNQPSRTVTSYLSNEILWGNTFRSCVKYDTKKKSYKVSHKRFNATTEVYTPLCSAKKLFEIYSEIVHHRSYSTSTEDSPEEANLSTSVSPESGIAVSPLLDRQGGQGGTHYESSDFSSSESFDEEEERSMMSRFQIRKKSSVIVSSLLDSLQKYVSNDSSKNNTSGRKNPPLETAL
ncbi:G protein-activated inward rectifier potassium channel 2-like [Coccinella septempunctata]|uniref:G protein-activated inward rectifier potassium channel 2-like n=1 Tax=Coccinella septempunctata TaxID=41139 RepID=UPI001D05F823|nr:G protein-activated inward rectifier potassium channel 2-like [Coccinella septempunctata]